MVGNTMPQDFGTAQMKLLLWTNWGVFFAYGFSYKKFMLALSLQQIWVGVFVKS